MLKRRGTVGIAPDAHYVPPGRMVDPGAFVFSVVWEDWDADAQEGELIEHGEVSGAEAAIAWGQERSDIVLIRLAHTEESYFSAGRTYATNRADGQPPHPHWPPDGPPPEGWWTPSDEAAAQDAAYEKAGHEPPDPRRLGVSEPEIRFDR